MLLFFVELEIVGLGVLLIDFVGEFCFYVVCKFCDFIGFVFVWIGFGIFDIFVGWYYVIVGGVEFVIIEIVE